jgi:5-methylcytosine-specific restriction enzyme B
LAEEIREYVDENYVKPARKRGDSELVIVSGEVHVRMGLKNRMPAICSVLRGGKLQESSSIRLINEIRLPSVKRDSSTNKFVFRVV